MTTVLVMNITITIVKVCFPFDHPQCLALKNASLLSITSGHLMSTVTCAHSSITVDSYHIFPIFGNNMFLGFWMLSSIPGFSQGDYIAVYALLGEDQVPFFCHCF